MMKKLSTLVCALVLAMSAQVSAQSTNVNSNSVEAQLQDTAVIQQMRQERDVFLEKLSTGIQREQEDAIRAAIDGNFSKLRQVRAFRDRELICPAGVKQVETTAKKMRLYVPEGSTEKDSLPLLIYAHGGGWTFGSMNSCAKFCHLMVLQGVAVLAIDYPLSPEQHYPAAMNACSAAYDYALTMAASWGVDPTRIFIGGDSAGGNLALAMALSRIKQGKSLPAGVVAFYPVTKVWTDAESTSWQTYGMGYALNASLMNIMNEAYLGMNMALDPLISPALANNELLQNMPPTMLLGGTADILYDQWQEFYQNLKEVNPKAQAYTLEEAAHLFITVEGQPTARNLAVALTTQFMGQR